MSILTTYKYICCGFVKSVGGGVLSTPTQKFEEEEARQKILCFFFSLFSEVSLSPVSPSLFFVSRSLVEKKRKKARIFVQRRVENIVKTRARVSLGAFQPLFCFRKEYFHAINDRNRYENVRAVSIQGQFARLIFPLLLKLILVVEVSFYAAIE